MRPKVSGDSPRYLLQGLVEAELKLGLADSKPLCFSAAQCGGSGPGRSVPGHQGTTRTRCGDRVRTLRTTVRTHGAPALSP